MPDFADFHHGARDIGGALAAHRPVIGHEAFDAEFGAGRFHKIDFSRRFGPEAVDRDHRLQPELAHVLDMANEIAHARFERPQILLLEVFLLHAAVHLQRTDGGDEHDADGLEPGLAALDVDELLRPQIGAEAGFGDHVIGESQRRVVVARTELQPWAMLANGPPWTKAGVPSSVCTRLGASASLQQRRHRAVRP